MSLLFSALQEAIERGDSDQIAELTQKLLGGVQADSLHSRVLTAIRGKTLYRSIRSVCLGDKVLGRYGCLKLVSSLITHYVIDGEQTQGDLSTYQLGELYVLLGELLNGGGSEEDVRRCLKKRFGQLLLRGESGSVTGD